MSGLKKRSAEEGEGREGKVPICLFLLLIIILLYYVLWGGGMRGFGEVGGRGEIT